jgi:hypothetical protein
MDVCLLLDLFLDVSAEKTGWLDKERDDQKEEDNEVTHLA